MASEYKNCTCITRDQSVGGHYLKDQAYRLCELARRVKVDNDDCLHVCAEREVRHGTAAAEENCGRS